VALAPRSSPALKISTWHYDLTAMLPKPARRFTRPLDASGFVRLEQILHDSKNRTFQGDFKNVTVVPLGEEPGEEDRR